MSTQSVQSLRWQSTHEDDPHRPTCVICGVEKSLIRLSRHFRQGDLREDRIYQCLVCGMQDEMIVRS
jgi:DNA-directed RNA polymerase subunit M/transcription elongation factor TFIIS